MTKSAIRAAAISGFAALLVSSLLVIRPARADDDPFPEAPGKKTFVKVCSQCHALDPIATLRYSKEEWRALVYDMKGMGADATDEECDIIIDYLAKSFPRKDEKK
jgi:cytochrome c5